MKAHCSSLLVGALILFWSAASGAQEVEVAPAPPEASGTPISIGASYQVESKLLAQTRRINVYLPPSYEQGKARYPVLYLLDGGMEEDFLHIVGIASLAAGFRHIREFIVVGIEGIDRYHDMTPPSQNEEDLRRLPTHGGAAKFRQFLATELKPWAEARFRLTEESVLIGESLAGLFVAETLLRQPESFSGYVSVSPSLWWNDGQLAGEAGQLVRAQRPRLSDRRLYLAIADEGGGMREGFDRVAQALREHAADDFALTVVPFAGESHGTIFHPAALAAVRELFKTAAEAQSE